ncbi:MbtH family NRPS accessory protein [Oceanicella sp. SM1341]|uniref:MbtH family protein n=1 Tax=Oceanicella sp. SM1341 TaxID=1548889 RepID=UPI000E4EB0B0|nr:MbtH family NRPS accessory protein [Oceanicella sp. SM1341]
MTDETTLPETEHVVVISDEERYSIWPAWKDIPWGWRDGGVRGTKAECLAHIEEVWTDMRPLSLRRAMEAEDASAPAGD